MPTSVRVAVIVMSLLAGVLLLVAAVNLYVLQEFSARIASEQGLTESEAQRSILLLLAPYLVLGIVFALSAWFVPRRHAWARWVGLTAAAMLGMLHILSAAMGGGITILTLLLFILCLAAITSLAARSTTRWMPKLRARD